MAPCDTPARSTRESRRSQRVPGLPAARYRARSQRTLRASPQDAHSPARRETYSRNDYRIRIPMLDEIAKVSGEFDAALAAANDKRALDDLRVHYFGRKQGLVPALFARLREVPKEQKKEAGDALNKLPDRREQALAEKAARIAAQGLPADTIDVTLPSRMPRLGHLHPISIVRIDRKSTRLNSSHI